MQRIKNINSLQNRFHLRTYRFSKFYANKNVNVEIGTKSNIEEYEWLSTP